MAKILQSYTSLTTPTIQSLSITVMEFHVTIVYIFCSFEKCSREMLYRNGIHRLRSLFLK